VESTGTFLDGWCPQAGVFPYLSVYLEACTTPTPRQMCAALAFLRQHQRAIGLVTLDIGANDLRILSKTWGPGILRPLSRGG